MIRLVLLRIFYKKKNWDQLVVPYSLICMVKQHQKKIAFGHYFDGKVSAILGTHTHIPTSDAKILDGGTAYQTDVGMTGDYNSVIGMDKENPIHGFVKGYRSEGRFFPADNKVTICGTYIEIDDSTGLSLKIIPFQM